MPFDGGDQRRTRVALLTRGSANATPVDSKVAGAATLDNVETTPEQQDNAQPGAADGQATTTSVMPFVVAVPPRRVRALSVAGAVLVMLTFLLLLSDSSPLQSHRVTAATVRPTATARATATATVFPTPTPMTGFQVYQDTTEGFLIQYPVPWTHAPASPGIEFNDNAKVPGYIMQVLVPGDATSVAQGQNAQDASTWVNYELSNLAKQWGSNYSQVPGPTPAVRVNTVTWQSGEAELSVNQTRIHVQVYATVHDGKPYIVNELAAEDQFTSGSQQYFTPMMRSLTFLPAGA